MPNLNPVHPGDTIKADDYNLILENIKGMKSPTNFENSGFVFSNATLPSAKDNAPLMAKIIKLTGPKQLNNWEIVPESEDDWPNAILMKWNYIEMGWSEVDGGYIEVILSNDGVYGDHASTIPLIEGSVIPVYYSKTANAYFPLSQPQVGIVEITSVEAGPDSKQTAQLLNYKDGDWAVVREVKVIRIGVL